MTQKIVDACEKHWDTHKSDCSGFVRAVAEELGVFLSGNADTIVGTMQSAGWAVLADGAEAAAKAQAGNLVVGGLRGKDQKPPCANGHVVVIVPGPLAHGKYPTAYWGSLGAVGRKNTTLNWSWAKSERDAVIYAAHPI